MRSDLDALMQEHGLDGLVITGPAMHNPAMVYFTGVAPLSDATLIKKCGEQAILYHNPLERDEAAHTGLRIRDLSAYPFQQYLQQANGDYTRAVVLRYEQMLAEQGLTSGRLGLYGLSDAGVSYEIFSALQRQMPGLRLAGEMSASVLLEAMATKDAAEIEHIRRIGRVTTEVAGLVADFLTGHSVRGEALVKAGGEPLTIGDVKNKINLWLAERGAENPEGTIFAIGRDAGVPHSGGNSQDALSLGKTIVFDFYPCEAGGGYFYDFTRTWCLGYAPDAVLALFEDVRAVYTRVLDSLKAGSLCSDYQKYACELFEARGHPSILSNPQTQEGYVHGLGHGVGLNVHEYPRFIRNTTDRDRLFPGVVVTIEPGLYYPEQGMGVRLEDTVWVRPDGQMEILADYPLDLVLPMRST